MYKNVIVAQQTATKNSFFQTKSFLKLRKRYITKLSPGVCVRVCVRECVRVCVILV